MKSSAPCTSKSGSRNALFFLLGIVILWGPVGPDALAQGFMDTGEKVCGFFDNINGLLNVASIAVVTIAVIFAGYQIAFAHKRISDVAPILIGGLFIGAAGQIATMLIGDTGESCGASAMLLTAMPLVHA